MISQRKGASAGVAAAALLALSLTTGFGGSPASTPTTQPATAGSAAAGGDFVIGVSNTLAGNGWREEMICAVKAQALASGNVSQVIAISKNGGPTEQIQDLQNLISQGVNAIIVNPSDREQLNPVIEEAIAQGIVVVAVDQAVTRRGRLRRHQRPGGLRPPRRPVARRRSSAARASVLYMRGIDGVPADDDRDTGFHEVMAKYPDIKLKEVYSGWDFTQGGDIAVQELTASDYDGVWTSGIDYTVVNAFDTVGKDPVPVVGADNNEFIHQLIEGQPGAAVTNPAVIGGVGTAIAIDALTGGEPEQVTTLTPQVWDAETTRPSSRRTTSPTATRRSRRPCPSRATPPTRPSSSSTARAPASDPTLSRRAFHPAGGQTRRGRRANTLLDT